MKRAQVVVRGAGSRWGKQGEQVAGRKVQGEHRTYSRRQALQGDRQQEGKW